MEEAEIGKSVLSELVADGLRMMEEQYAHLFGVEEVAEKLGVTKFHLIRSFKKCTGTTPGKRLNQVRVEQAKGLLLSTKHPLEVIANVVGFANANYFCKVFRQNTGLSPHGFRKQGGEILPLILEIEQKIFL